MTTEICNPADILQLNKTKEFTLISTYLLEALLTDTRLLAESAKLWQILFNRARFDENLEVRISYRELANILGKSVRSICRYISDLVQKHYLSIQNNYLVNDGQTINSIYVRFPQHIINSALQSKDRITTAPQTNTGHLAIDKSDRQMDDNHVIANNSINYKNKITNNIETEITSVVVECEMNLQKQLHTKQQELTALQQSMAMLQQQLSCANDAIVQFDLMRKFTEHDAAIALTTHAIARLEETHVKQQQQNTHRQHLQQRGDYINQQTGERKLSAFTLKRLQYVLQENGYNGAQQKQLMNEVVHEVRFGSLVLSNQTQQILPVEHAINIALKLIREKRWCSPNALICKAS